FQLWRAARDKISRASSLVWPNNNTNPRTVGAFSAVGVVEALQNCQDCRHGNPTFAEGARTRRRWWGKADACPRNQRLQMTIHWRSQFRYLVVSRLVVFVFASRSA